MVNRHQKAIERLDKLKAAREDNMARQKALRNYIDTLTTAPLMLDAWDEQLWRLLVVKGVVGGNGSIDFRFRGENMVHVPHM